MKLFNPFKWHIVSFCKSKYSVRRFSFFYLNWVYMDKEEPIYTVFTKHCRGKYCELDSLYEARELLRAFNENKLDRFIGL